MNYEVLRNHLFIIDTEYLAGDTVSHVDGYPFDVLVRQGYLKPTDEVVKTQTVAPKQDKLAYITKSGIWFKVIDEDGETIGKATRDEEEAKEIKAAYEAS